MALRVAVRTRGVKEFQAVLRRVNPSRNPEVGRRGLLKIAKRLEQVTVREFMSGPRPRRLGQVTGETARSLQSDRSELPRAIETGIPRALFWVDVHEEGLGRWPRRAFIEPALERVLPEMADLFIAGWMEAAKLGRGAARQGVGL